jgi:hypothetical protein
MEAYEYALKADLPDLEEAYLSHRFLARFWRDQGYFKAAMWNRLMVTQTAIALSLLEARTDQARRRQLSLLDASADPAASEGQVQ